MPDIALIPNPYALRVPGTVSEFIVHREVNEDYVYLFESMLDADAVASWAAPICGWKPVVEAVPLEALAAFRIARYKPSNGDSVDLPILGPTTG